MNEIRPWLIMSHIASYMIGIGSGIGLERYLRGPRQ